MPSCHSSFDSLFDTTPEDSDTTNTSLIDMEFTTTQHGYRSVTTASSITNNFNQDEIIESQKETIAGKDRELSMIRGVLNEIKAPGNVDNNQTVLALIQDKLDLEETVQVLRQQSAYWEELSKTTSSYSSKKSMIKKTMANNKALRRYMRDNMQLYIFPFCKFTSKKCLHCIAEGGIAATIMTRMNVPKKDWHLWWSTNVVIAEGLFTEHKTTATQQMKNAFNKGDVSKILQYQSSSMNKI